jgi:hypothetical protein
MSAVSPVQRRSLPAQRFAYLFLGLVAAGAALALDGLSWQLWVFALAPDLPLLAGGARGLQPGQLHPRAVPFYNATHRLVGPLALTALGCWSLAVTGMPGVLVAGTAWLAHVGLDRACGYGLRDRAGFVRA